jgi:hypothetical protein
MDGIHQTLGMFCLYNVISPLTAVPVLVQQLASDINKSRRAFNYRSTSAANGG